MKNKIIHVSIICNALKVEKVQISINSKMDKYQHILLKKFYTAMRLKEFSNFSQRIQMQPHHKF